MNEEMPNIKSNKYIDLSDLPSPQQLLESPNENESILFSQVIDTNE